MDRGTSIGFKRGLACSMASVFGTSSGKILVKVVEERFRCKWEDCEKAERDILCFDNLPARALTSRFSGA